MGLSQIRLANEEVLKDHQISFNTDILELGQIKDIDIHNDHVYKYRLRSNTLTSKYMHVYCVCMYEYMCSMLIIYTTKKFRKMDFRVTLPDKNMGISVKWGSSGRAFVPILPNLPGQ